jgi:hypothetical protein
MSCALVPLGLSKSSEFCIPTTNRVTLTVVAVK